jgi:hypothetical protein
MKFLFISSLLASAVSANSETKVDSTINVEERLRHLESYVESALSAQREHYEKVLQDQQDTFKHQLAQLQKFKNPVTVSGSSGKPRRKLAIDTDAYGGIHIAKDDAALFFGEDADIALARTGEGELAIVGNVEIDGSFYLSDVDGNVAEILNSLTSAETTSEETLAKASSWFPDSDMAEYDSGDPFGYENCEVVFDYPYTAALGYGRMRNGIFTAPEDGVYFMTVEVRVVDSDTTYTEIEFYVNDDDADNFEMWIPEGDSSGRRTGVSCFLTELKMGDTLYPLSDIAPSEMKAQTDVFQIGADRVTFNVVGTGTHEETQVPILEGFTESSSFVSPSEYSSSLVDGVFTAPRDGVYYFACKVRTSDNNEGDMEIEWKLNDADAERFEMWLHTGDGYDRRAHMSSILLSLSEGDTVFPTSDLTFDVSAKAIFSGFELPDNLPAFKVQATSSFEYETKYVPYGEEADTSLEFERETDGAYDAGIYTVPEDGFYYFTMKVRTTDGVSDDLGIEFLVNGEDAAHNMVMWLHQGDSYGRRSGMSTTLLKLKAGDEVCGVSNLDLDSSDTVSSWTFSGFKLA